MGSILAAALTDYEVMTTEGTQLGTVENITMNPKTGDLHALRLGSHDGGSGGYHEIDDGQLIVPADRIEAKEDYLLVRPPK
ncbi:PRC-barrel domain-containing protein [Halobellus limi]|jgi:sporulation protein YlmC with PRC-barrel domain|uniref:Photosystem reaction center subunit H n=2 Tax=Halobellus limi TaxID=699433 RepID=A0A1H5SRD9_9EURY|nr:PRC-barrel domain-containing protein [Halobellus limi]QCC47521.1 photosystem reaction center subunit H [Halobellus limi]SEF52538.1 Sporulation protein YlmC, PRC-barrel domain family [Halobellus limi]